MNLIELSGVKKKYGDKNVVNGIGFSIEKGEIFGLLGPNGAGKTTTISMMSAQLQQDEGTIHVHNLSNREHAKKIKSIVGVVPQEISLYSVLSAYDNLLFFGALYGMKGKKLKQKIDWILDLIGLKERAKDPIKSYSGGMKRRINIAAALLHDPVVLFMDEPTVGIDPQSRNKIYELIKLLKEQGMTIVYTTHYMEEASVLCDRIAIIDNGQIIEMGKTEELIAKVSGGMIELKLESYEMAQKALSIVTELEECKSLVVERMIMDNQLTLVVKDSQVALRVIMEIFAARSIQIMSMNLLPPTLETLFLHLTGKTLRD